MLVDGRARRLLVFVVPDHHLGTTHQDLPVVRDPDLRPRHRLPDGPDAEVLERVHVGDRTRLGEPVPLEDGDADGVEERRERRLQRRGLTVDPECL